MTYDGQQWSETAIPGLHVRPAPGLPVTQGPKGPQATGVSVI
ncbi:hypothetical protein [Streptomyces longwoodensis]